MIERNMNHIYICDVHFFTVSNFVSVINFPENISLSHISFLVCRERVFVCVASNSIILKIEKYSMYKSYTNRVTIQFRLSALTHKYRLFQNLLYFPEMKYRFFFVTEHNMKYKFFISLHFFPVLLNCSS